MAQQVTINIVDDLDGTGHAETIAFSYDGKDYEIDLGPRNRDTLNEALKPFIAVARPAPKRRKTKGTGKPFGYNPAHSQQIRTWAASAGIEVAAVGRIPLEVVEKWKQARVADGLPETPGWPTGSLR